jgi:hypothetical protein
MSKKNQEGEAGVSGDTASMGQTGEIAGDVPVAEVGADVVYDTDIVAINTLTEKEAEAKVAEGSMMRIDTADGNFVYVINLDDTDYLKSQIEISDDQTRLII